jgi:hypothetical protein
MGHVNVIIIAFISSQYSSFCDMALLDGNFRKIVCDVCNHVRGTKGVQLCCFGNTVYKKVNKGSREIDPSQVYFGWNGGKIQILFIANFFTQKILFCYCLNKF